MISAKKLFIVSLSLFFAAVLGLVLEIFHFTFGRYIAYVAVPIGALVILVGAIAAMAGQVKNDLKE